MIPACVLIFGGSYYLGKASLMLFIGSMEHSRKPGPSPTGDAADKLSPADPVVQ